MSSELLVAIIGRSVVNTFGCVQRQEVRNEHWRVMNTQSAENKRSSVVSHTPGPSLVVTYTHLIKN